MTYISKNNYRRYRKGISLATLAVFLLISIICTSTAVGEAIVGDPVLGADDPILGTKHDFTGLNDRAGVVAMAGVATFRQKRRAPSPAILAASRAGTALYRPWRITSSTAPLAATHSIPNQAHQIQSVCFACRAMTGRWLSTWWYFHPRHLIQQQTTRCTCASMLRTISKAVANATMVQLHTILP